MNAAATRIARMTAALGAGIATVLLTAAPASAHARVVRTTPGDGATSDGRLKVISVVFDESVRAVPRSLVVTGATGAPQTTGPPRVVGGRILEAPVSGRLPAGRYFVGWRILSDDGHIESGSFGFSVAAAGAAGANTAGGLPPPPAEPVWPVIVAASMAALACLGAALVVVRGLSAVRAGSSPEHYPPDDISTVSAPADAASRR